MNSFKNPLIAIASAVALAGAMLVAGPANAASTALTIGGSSASGGTTTATAIAVPVPADNDVNSATALRIALTGVANNTVVTATATGLKLVTKVTVGSEVVKADAGASSVSVNTGSGTTADIYVYTTSTTAGSVSVSVGGNTTVYFVKGTAGPAYTVSVTAPAFAGLGASVNLTATAKDVFGNAVENAVITTTVLRGTVATQLTWNATDKVYKGVLTAPATAGADFGVARISATEVAGLGKPTLEASFSVSVLDLNDAITAANAKLAELEAKVAKLEKRVANLKKKNKKLRNR
jgi:hypothetical protein